MMPKSPYELRRIQLSIENGNMCYHNDDGAFIDKHQHSLEELTKLNDMLIWLGTTNVVPETGEVREEYFHVYTCRHHDTVTGDCKNYENRPIMCSSYPNGRRCAYVGCTREHSELPQVDQLPTS